MGRTILTTVVLLVLVGAVMFARSGPVPRPAVLSHQLLSDALAANASSERLLLVKASAEWCGPCQRMNAETFVDRGVVQAIESLGSAIEFDVDEHPQDAQRLSVRSIPLLVAFRRGHEVGRIEGFKDPAELRSWLAALPK